MDKYLKNPSLFRELTEVKGSEEEVENLFKKFNQECKFLAINSIYTEVTGDWNPHTSQMSIAYDEINNFLNGKEETSYEKSVTMFKMFLDSYNEAKHLFDKIKFRYDHRLTYFYKEDLYDADLDTLTVNGLIDVPNKMASYYNLILKSGSDQIEVAVGRYRSKMELMEEIYFGETYLQELARQLLEQLWFVKILADGWDEQVKAGTKTYEEAPTYIKAYNRLREYYYSNNSIKFVNDLYDIPVMQDYIFTHCMMMKNAILPLLASYHEITNVIDRELTLFRESKEKERDAVYEFSNKVYGSILTINTGIKEIGTLAVEFTYYNMVTGPLLNDRSLIAQLRRLSWISRVLIKDEPGLIGKKEYQSLIKDSEAILTALFARSDIEELFLKMEQCYNNGVYKNYLDAKRGKEIVYKYVEEHFSNWRDDINLIIEDKTEALLKTNLFTDIANELKYIFEKLSLIRIGDPYTLVRKL